MDWVGEIPPSLSEVFQKHCGEHLRHLSTIGNGGEQPRLVAHCPNLESLCIALDCWCDGCPSLAEYADALGRHGSLRNLLLVYPYGIEAATHESNPSELVELIRTSPAFSGLRSLRMFNPSGPSEIIELPGDMQRLREFCDGRGLALDDSPATGQGDDWDRLVGKELQS